ncbi:MAG TPA: hypothetical protein VK277_08925 [Acidimicrobiales bacterium]|nr:hypothetical protein [Acidimicrobiales bacterium]
MTDDGARATADPPAPPPEVGPVAWYRRRAVLVGAVVALILAVTVITDLPVHSSRAADISAERSVMKEVNTDLGGCAYAVHEAFLIYQKESSGSLTLTERGQVPGLLRDDQAACSFTNEAIFNLANIEVPGSPAGKHLGALVGTTTLWATSDALGAVEDIQTLSTQPTNNRALTDLGRRERTLAADRRSADAEVAEADRVLDTNLPPPDLPALPTPTGR